MPEFGEGGDPEVSPEVFEFPVETNFQRQARRPGGVTRDEALARASREIEQLRPLSEQHLLRALERALHVLPGAETPATDAANLEDAIAPLQHLADVGATIGYPLLSFVANNLCILIRAIKGGAHSHPEVIACHVSALRLAAGRRHRHLGPEALPELAAGLSQVLGLLQTQPRAEGSGPQVRQ